MPVWLCKTCAAEFPDTAIPPAHCAICADERQYLPPAGQLWTNLEEMRQDRSWSLTEVEPGLLALTVTPPIGIGQRGFLIVTPHGNILWEAPAFHDDALLNELRRHGDLIAITASHPHLIGGAVSLGHALGGAPIYWNGLDQRWIQRPDPAIQFWRHTLELAPGVTLHECGGHFAGSCVLLWATGANGKGVLLVGDTMMVGADQGTVTFLRSYPNRIPLSERSVRRIADTVASLPYDVVHSNFEAGVITSNAAERVQYSANRYIGWLRDDIRDPDEEH